MVFVVFYRYPARMARAHGHNLTTEAMPGALPEVFYPAFIDLAGRRCLVVGGGPVGTEKTEKLIDAGADVRLVSPQITPRLEALVAEGAIGEFHRRGYETADLDGCLLVVAATADAEINLRVWQDAEARTMLVNVVDVPPLCNFIVPSIMRHGELAVAVSTGGASPVVARTVRERIEAEIGPEWGELVTLMRQTRDELKERFTTMPTRAAAVERLLESGVVDRLAAGDREGALALIQEHLGVAVPA
jgi:precorrin-2 dehydrogenase / sirohydrochlorin ferrochelatase